MKFFLPVLHSASENVSSIAQTQFFLDDSFPHKYILLLTENVTVAAALYRLQGLG